MGKPGSKIEKNAVQNEEVDIDLMLRDVELSGLIPDVGIDDSLVKYSGLYSAARLEKSITQVLKDRTSRIPGFVQSLCSALAPFTKVPNAVGLGAVALAIALELIISAQQESKDSTLDMLRRVFPENKASDVRDLMEEYLKRLRMYFHQPSRAIEETERLEKQLSEQLTRLKNSMLHDKQMSSHSLKHWTNGAAFHLQMLIHAARLKQNDTEDEAHLTVQMASIISVLNSYQFDLEELLKKYKTYIRSNIFIVILPVICRHFPTVGDKEFGKINVSFLRWKTRADEYVDYMFDNPAQLKELKCYFSNLKENIKDLIMQNNEFNMQSVLSVSNSQDACCM